MAFQLKNFSSIVASLINYMRGTTAQVTDFNVGSVARTLVEAPAVEIEELYLQYFNGLNEAIPVSLYMSLGFDALAAVAATNMIRVTIASSSVAQLIPAGTVFASVGYSASYTSAADTTIAAGNTYADVLVVARTPGAAGNIPAGLPFTLTPVPVGFVSASNLSPFANGADAESDSDRKIRFNAYVRSLSRGTPTALMYGMKTSSLVDASGNELERVQKAAVIEPYTTDPTKPVALVELYIHNGVGNTSSALINRTRDVIYGYYDANGVAVPGWKSAGVQVNVYAATEQLVPVTGTLTILPGYDPTTVSAVAQSAIYGYIQGLDINAPALQAEIVATVMNLDGVANIVLSAPAGDTAASTKTKLMPGAITLTLQ